MIVSTVRRPWTAPVRSTTMPGLDVGVEHHRQRVLERRPLVDRRRDRVRLGCVERALGWESLVGDPADRPSAVVDDQQVARTAVAGRAPGVRGVVTGPAGRRLEREIADPQERQPLEAAVRADESGHELRRRAGEDLGRRPELGDLAAVLEHRDEIAHLDRLVDVVGDEQDRLGQLLLEAQELVLEPVADDRVDRPERFVHEHDRRVDREGPRHADPLALAAGQLVRVPIAVLGRVEPDQREELVGPLRWRSFVQPSRRGTVATFSPIVWWGNRPTCWMT